MSVCVSLSARTRLLRVSWDNRREELEPAGMGRGGVAVPADAVLSSLVSVLSVSHFCPLVSLEDPEWLVLQG